MEGQEELNQLMSEINTYQSQGELIQQQIETIQSSLAELEVLETTLKNIENGEKLETLVPIGAGSFINAEISNTKEIIMSMGAGIAITKDFDEALETIEKQKKDLAGVLEKMTENLRNVTERINMLSPRAEALMQQQQMNMQ